MTITTTKTKAKKEVSDAKLVDTLGEVKAMIANLVTQENALKAQLIARGVNASYDGELFRATVTQFEKGTLDMAAVRRKLDQKWIEDHTSYSMCTQVRVSARVREELEI